ncbi:MAG: tripartite tricarboxylate transporter permease [Alphaproteobacteria bacterium]|nr:tripartite tricarboxylate transporter permease [Alphaproteobacteria bacterium]
MSQLLDKLGLGFGVALTLKNFLYCLLGATLGTLVGVLPGLGPVTTIAMLLPITFKISPVASLIMLSGIYYGAHHAGSTTAIMLNMPGEPTSVVICIDGHPMARQGRAGAALCISALGSFFAGCVSVIVIALFSPPLADAALLFGAPEYTSMIIMALVTASVLSSASLITTIAMAVLGVLIGTVGTDVNSGVVRFSFGAEGLADGVSFVAVAVGLFAFAEVILHLGALEQRHRITSRIRGLLPTRADLSAAWKAILRGTAVGAGFGILPGTGPLISSFAAYALEKQIAADPSRFGNGAIEGVAGPEAANNAAALTHFIPMLTLGIPAGAAMALMLGALMIQGIAPGPQVMTQHPDLFWGVVASMWIGNMMLLVLNLPLVGVWVRLLAIPYRFLYPTILVFCCIGVYSVSNSAFDVFLAAGFGLVGYVFKRLNCAPAPLILGLVLGPVLEENLRRSLLISRGDPSVFFTRPISLAMLLLAVAFVVIFSLPALRRRREALT